MRDLSSQEYFVLQHSLRLARSFDCKGNASAWREFWELGPHIRADIAGYADEPDRFELYQFAERTHLLVACHEKVKRHRIIGQYFELRREHSQTWKMNGHDLDKIKARCNSPWTLGMYLSNPENAFMFRIGLAAAIVAAMFWLFVPSHATSLHDWYNGLGFAAKVLTYCSSLLIVFFTHAAALTLLIPPLVVDWWQDRKVRRRLAAQLDAYFPW